MALTVRTGEKLSAGFTLLEALVVLVITGLVSLVLVQGFGLVLAARTSVENKLVDIDQRVIERSVLLDPLRGILPDYPNRPNIFGGDARQLHGLTVRPLLERPGAPVGFTLRMDYDRGDDVTVLSYQEQGSAPIVLSQWPGDRGGFAYRDRSGPWSTIWPANPSSLAQPLAPGQSPQTPWLIRVDTGLGFPSTLIASVAGAHLRQLRLEDTPLGVSGPN